jgi:integrase
MAKILKPLTNTQVKQSKPREKVYALADGQGLQLRVKPNGSKLWIFNYYAPFTKKRTAISFGIYPNISIADARKQREGAKKLLAQNINPKESRDEKKRMDDIIHGNTLEHISTKWIEVKESTISSNHAKDIWRSLELHIFPSIGKVPIHKITAIKIIEIIEPVSAKGNLDTVKRLCQRLNEIMIYSVNTGLIQANPLSGISKAFKTPVKQHLPTLKPEKLPILMQTLAIANIKITTRCLIEWQLHTMVRPSEASGAKWSEIDFNNRLWNIPAERMKNKKDHSVPLTKQSLILLELMQTISAESDYVFPSDRNLKKHTNSQTANTALKRMGFKNQLVAHGLRSLASTILNEEGFDGDTIEAALAHTGSNEVRNAYNRADYIKRRTPLMEWWSEYIDKAATGNMSLTGRKELKLINN